MSDKTARITSRSIDKLMIAEKLLSELDVVPGMNPGIRHSVRVAKDLVSNVLTAIETDSAGGPVE